MKPLKRFKNLILIDKQDIYQIILYSIIAGLISLSLPLGIQSIINFIQAGKVSTSWMVLVLIVVIGVAFVGLLKIMQFRITENLQQKIFVRSSFEFAYRFPKIKFNQLMYKLKTGTQQEKAAAYNQIAQEPMFKEAYKKEMEMKEQKHQAKLREEKIKQRKKLKFTTKTMKK